MTETTDAKAEILSLSLQDRMKQYERLTGSVVPPTEFLVVRADGHGFSKFTRGFSRPFDPRIHKAMVSAAADAMEEFGAVSAYTQSDEITLVFPPCTETRREHIFRGRAKALRLGGFLRSREVRPPSQRVRVSRGRASLQNREGSLRLL